jgi:aspartyl-tRNA(Asn)/glutamyl-tRNA(Gln) amidotransferase subunit A
MLINWPEPSLAQLVEAEAKVEQLKSVFASYFQEHDVLLCPVTPLTAPPHGQLEYVVNGQKLSVAHCITDPSRPTQDGLAAKVCRSY